ncbi:MAG: hypothetical protein IJI48_03265 [Ruminococcus sp.]|nr:hypothetical protein [Ruminococcus sp.]
MKKTVSIICVVLVLALALSLTACGKDYSGTYKLVEISAAGQDMTSYLNKIGDVTLVIEGEKATLKMGKESTQMTVDSKAMTISSDGSAAPFTFEDNKLIMTEKNSDTKMVFEKQEEKQ